MLKNLYLYVKSMSYTLAPCAFSKSIYIFCSVHSHVLLIWSLVVYLGSGLSTLLMERRRSLLAASAACSTDLLVIGAGGGVAGGKGVPPRELAADLERGVRGVLVPGLSPHAPIRVYFSSNGASGSNTASSGLQ